jgi:hypothetical protein
MRTCWFIVIESMGSWWVDCEGKAYGPFISKDEARIEAIRIAITYGDADRRSEVFVSDERGIPRRIWAAPLRRVA